MSKKSESNWISCWPKKSSNIRPDKYTGKNNPGFLSMTLPISCPTVRWQAHIDDLTDKKVIGMVIDMCRVVKLIDTGQKHDMCLWSSISLVIVERRHNPTNKVLAFSLPRLNLLFDLDFSLPFVCPTFARCPKSWNIRNLAFYAN